MTAALVGLAIILGATTQRVTGMGFALVAGPLLVLLLGPGPGVLLEQVVGIVVSALVFVTVWRDVDWRVLPWLLVPALVGTVPGVMVAKVLPDAWLQVAVGWLVLVALLATLASARARVFHGRRGATASGLLSGFMNATAGVGGPAIVLYRISSDWPHRAFVATAQVYFTVISAAVIGARGVPHLTTATWAAAGVALFVGLGLGSLLAPRVPERTARRLVVAVALVGAVATIVKGATALAG